MPRGTASILAATGLVSVVTAVTRIWQLPIRELAATPQSVADGRLWLLATSALLADRPAYASILGLLVVGVATVWLCGARVVWIAAATGHVLSAAIVYLAIGLVRFADPDAYESVLHLPDYGTSAIIAAWIGAIACVLWRRRRRTAAVALCIVSALLGWYFKGALTVLDTEHAVALAFGVAAVSYRPRSAAAAARWRIRATRGETEKPSTTRGRPTAGVPVKPA
jgi:hypothetical protein